MTKQEIFEKIATHLLTQNKKSMTTFPITKVRDGQICAYRGDNNTKCAVGLLIPDEIYNENMEKKNVQELLEEFPLALSHLKLEEDDKRIFLLIDMQSIHDNIEPYEWKSSLQKYAVKYNLDKTFLNQFNQNDESAADRN